MTISSSQTVTIDSSHFLSLAVPAHITPVLTLDVTEHCFLPRPDDLQADWVASVAAPAFRLLRDERGASACRSFCSIGTGCGIDALAAVELLESTLIGITDVHLDVVAAAESNIGRNLQNPNATTVIAGTGDLLTPLRGAANQFDVIYENLPNIPLDESGPEDAKRASSSFLAPRTEPIPAAVRDNLLSLHYVALLQAKDFLKPGGVVLSMLGGRVPLRALLGMADAAGFKGRFLSYGWKVQNVAEEVISGHVAWQRQGLGPFHFYQIDDLERVFAGLEPERAAGIALEIEEQLAPFAIDAEEALVVVRSGTRIGHTFAALVSSRE
jgi:methylase of polypeptide subunit release factors